MSRLLRPDMLNRRQMLRGAGVGLTGAGAALLFGCGSDDDEGAPSPSVPGEEPPPEVTSIRVPKVYAACAAPLLLAKPFLLEEGFTNVEYVITELKYSLINDYLVSDKVDMAFNFTPALVHAIDAGEPLVMLGSAHVACFQVLAGTHVPHVSDLAGKRIGIFENEPQPSDFAFITSVLQHIGLTPGRDVELTVIPRGGISGATFDNGKVDGAMALAPRTLQMRDTNDGHVILDSMLTSPWSEQVCCQLVTSQRFMEQNPVATKRAMRAVLRAVDYCVSQPEKAAQTLYDQQWITPYIYARESMEMVAFDAWRTHNPDDTIRFHALRLNEAEMIKSTPDEILARGTDFRFFNELKREMAFAPGAAPLRAGLLNCDTNVAGPLAWAPDAGGKRARGARS